MNRQDVIKWLKAIVYVGVYGGLLIPLMFVPVVIFPFVFSKLIFFQILIGLTLPAYIILAWVEPQYRPRWTPLYCAIVAYYVALLISVIFAVDPLRAWWGNQERMNGLFTLLHFFAWFTMAASLLKTWSQWKKLLIYEVILGGIGAIVALLQIPFPNLLMFPAGARPGGLLDNPIYMAAYQIFNLFFIVLLWLKTKKNWGFRIFLVVMAVLDLVAFISAQSRGALVGLFAGIGIFALTYAIMTPNKKAKKLVIGLAVAAVAIYGLIFALRNTAFIQATPLNRLTNISVTTETRFIAWKIGWQGFLERPLTGYGLDDFHILFNAKYNPKSLENGYYETWFDRAHNTVIDMLSMTGLFGFLTYFAIFGALFYSVIKAYRHKWIDIPTASVFIALPVGYFVQNLFVFDQPAGFTMSYILYAFIAAATCAPFIQTGEHEAKTEDKPGKTRAIPYIGWGVVQVVMLIVVWRFSYLPVKASYLTIKSNNYFSAGALPQALDYAKQASVIPTPYLDEQTFLQARNMISFLQSGSLEKFPDWKVWHDLVVNMTEQQLKEHPSNTNPLFVYARFLDSFSQAVPADSALAEKEYLAAIQTSPKRQQLLYSLAQFYLRSGNKQQGYDLFKQAYDDDPNVGESSWYVGISDMFDLNRQDQGAKEMVAAMNATSPYQLKSAQEAVALSMACVVEHDNECYRSMLKQLPTLSGGSTQMYLEIARAAEELGLTQERNLLLGAIVQIDPTLASHLVPLQNGTATSIEQSLKMTSTIATTTQSTAAATTSTATSSGELRDGPRRK